MNEESSVPFTEFWAWLQALPISEHIGFTWWFPLLESIHVLAIGLVVGTILMVDLRLLGLAATRYPASRVTLELVPWTWIGFVVAFTTGFGMFAAGATRYVENPAFQIKFMLLPLASYCAAPAPQIRALSRHALWVFPYGINSAENKTPLHEGS